MIQRFLIPIIMNGGVVLKHFTFMNDFMDIAKGHSIRGSEPVSK